MPTYTPNPFIFFLHPAPQNPCYAPHKWTVPQYGQITQYEKGPDNTPSLDEKGTKYLQEKVGSIMYYSQKIYPTMLPDLNEISAIQVKPTLNTKLAIDMLLNYSYIYPNAKICYQPREMILYVE